MCTALYYGALLKLGILQAIESDMMDSNARRRGFCWNLLWRAMPLMLATACKWKQEHREG